MKRIIFLFSIIAFFISFSNVYADTSLKDYEATRISITLEEGKEISPDFFNMNFSLEAKAEKESEVINMLGSVDKLVRELKIDYTGGSYSVYKNCWWEKNKWKCLGYKGDLSYSFKLKDPKEQNKILDLVEEIKEKYGEKVNYTVSNPQWIITEKKYKEVEASLKIEIIDKATDFAKKVGEKIGRKCFISNIDYNIKSFYWEQPVIYRSAVAEMAKTIEAPEPKKEDKTVTVKAQIKFICIDKK